VYLHVGMDEGAKIQEIFQDLDCLWWWWVTLAQFMSTEFQNFMETNGIQHKFSAPAHLSKNSQTERYVQTVKKEA